jgi:uncharacterized metal-binding protein YceD (DUF177 family)
MAKPAVNEDWSALVHLSEVQRGRLRRHLSAPEAVRQAQARLLNLQAVQALEADLTLSPWLDGASLTGRFTATVVQTCGVSLEPFESTVQGEIDLKLVSAGSPNAPVLDVEIDLDPEADDPPEVMESPEIDLGRYLFEHLALELDPFPRKPGAVFEPPAEPSNISPFAALAALKAKPAD